MLARFTFFLAPLWNPTMYHYHNRTKQHPQKGRSKTIPKLSKTVERSAKPLILVGGEGTYCTHKIIWMAAFFSKQQKVTLYHRDFVGPCSTLSGKINVFFGSVTSTLRPELEWRSWPGLLDLLGQRWNLWQFWSLTCYNWVYNGI